MTTIFKYSGKDAWLVIIALLQLPVMTAWCGYFSEISWAWHVAIGLLMSLVFYFNPIVITHNFLHCPFFTNKKANLLFAVFNSANLLLPQSLYKHHHILHHIHSNDRYKENCENGRTMDPSSTFRYGKNGEQEHFLSYSLLGLFRDGTRSSFRRLLAKNDLVVFVAELVAIVTVLSLWIYLNWQWVLVGALPVFYLGWALAHMENYFEHHRASNPESRYADSVSYYGGLYNLIMFNEGYHQEHHVAPGKHWSQRPAIRQHYLRKFQSEGAVTGEFPPLLGFWETKQVGIAELGDRI